MAERREQEYRFGEKLKKVRERKNLTLKSLSQAVGVSTSLLSQIENNKVSPSIDTLLAITDELDIDPEYVFRDLKKPRKVKIVRRDERSQMRLQKVIYEQLSAPIGAEEEYAFEVLELTLAPQAQRGNDEFGHLGREMGIIISGSGRLQYGSQEYELTEGDSVCFSSEMPHLLVNTGEGELKAIWIVSPPRVFT